jgi:hypothetical protein
MALDKALKPFAMFARTTNTLRFIAHDFAIVAQTALRIDRRLTSH